MERNGVAIVELQCLKICRHLWWIRLCDMMSHGRAMTEDCPSPFLGFANFYHWFLKDFSHRARQLFNLIRNEQKWQWGSPKASAFWKLKELVTSTPVLTTPADDQPFHIEADSSDFALWHTEQAACNSPFKCLFSSNTCCNWFFMFCCSALLVLFFIPFSIFYWEFSKQSRSVRKNKSPHSGNHATADHIP